MKVTFQLNFHLKCFSQIRFQVAYAHPVREQPLYYAGHPPVPAAGPGPSSFGTPAPQPQMGYPYFYGSQAPSQQFVGNSSDPNSRVGHAKVKRAPNSDCMLHDPAETLVVRENTFVETTLELLLLIKFLLLSLSVFYSIKTGIFSIYSKK